MLPFSMLLIGLAGTIYYVHFSGEVKKSTKLDLMLLVIIGIAAYALYLPIKMIRNRVPVLTLTRSSITINKGKNPVTFLWQEVTQWETENDEGSIMLTVHTATAKNKVNLSSLDMKVDEIVDLLNKYKKM